MATAKEKIYDEQIAPLMKQVLDICKEHKIAVIVTFALGKSHEDDEGQLLCTSALLTDQYEPNASMRMAATILLPLGTVPISGEIENV